MAATLASSPERLSAAQLGNTAPLVRGSLQGSWAAQRARQSHGSPDRRSFGQRLSSVDHRTQRLMVLQKKMQLTEAMEKRLRLDTKNLGAQRPLTPELLSHVGESVDGMLAMDSFWKDAGGVPALAGTRSAKDARASPSLFDSELLRTSGRISVAALGRSPALALKSQELRSTGAIPGGRSQEVIVAKERRLRTAGQQHLSQSLPDVRWPESSPAPEPQGKARRARGHRRRSQRASNPMHEAQEKKPMERAEGIIKRLVRDQMRELEAAFKQADTDRSGSLDEIELRNLLYRFNILMEDDLFFDVSSLSLSLSLSLTRSMTSSPS